MDATGQEVISSTTMVGFLLKVTVTSTGSPQVPSFGVKVTVTVPAEVTVSLLSAMVALPALSAKDTVFIVHSPGTDAGALDVAGSDTSSSSQ